MTGPEIWEQTGGEVDAVTFSTGTGGTLAGGWIHVGVGMHAQHEGFWF